MKKEIKEYIDNIEQLAADARYYYDYENIDKVELKIESIEAWVKKAKREINKIKKEK